MHFESLFDELAKLGAISDEQARASLDRLETLRQDAPTTGRIARYAAFGAATAPVVSAVGNVIAGKPAIQAAGMGRRLAVREVANQAAKGALGAGALPLLQTRLDQHAEIRNLKKYLAQQEQPSPELPKQAAGLAKMAISTKALSVIIPGVIGAAGGAALGAEMAPPKKGARTKYMLGGALAGGLFGGGAGYFDHRANQSLPHNFTKFTDQDARDFAQRHYGHGNFNYVRKHYDNGIGVRVKEVVKDVPRLAAKYAFQTSQYSGPLSYGPFKQESGLPNKPPPRLDESPVEKKGGVMTPTGVTPAARLSSAMRIGAPKVTSPSGPSIADVAKPRGFGKPMVGATIK